MSIDYSKLDVETLKLLKRKKELELELASSEPEETTLTSLEEAMAYPAAAAKGISFGMDKYIGGAGEAIARAVTGQPIGSPVADYEAMRNRQIEMGGIGPKTVEAGASVLSPLKLALNPIVNTISQAALYGMTERSSNPIEGGAMGAAVGAAIPAVGTLGSLGAKSLKYASEILGVDTNMLAKTISNPTPMTTQAQRDAALEALNKGYIKASSEAGAAIESKKQEIGSGIKGMFDYLDRVVGRKIPSTEVTGYPREQVESGKWAGINMRPLEAGSMYGEGKGYTGLTRPDSSGITVMDAAEQSAQTKTFFKKFTDNKNKFVSNMRNAADNMNFASPQEKAEYIASLDNLTIETDEEIQKELARAMDGRVTEATHNSVMDSLENSFYNKLDAINKKYIQNITPSELRGFRDEVYNMLNYGKSKAKGTIGSQRVSLDITPQGGENQMFADELKAVGRKAKEKIEDYATYHGVPLADYNKKFNLLSDLEDVIPSPNELASVSRSDELTGISMRVKNAIDSLRSSGQHDIADMLESNIMNSVSQRKQINLADRSGGEITGLVRVPEQVMARAGNAFQRNIYTPIARQPIMKAIGKIDPNRIMPYAGSAAASENGRKPQSIEEVAYMKLPRNTEEAIQSPELLIEKVKQLDPNSLPILTHAINEDPEKLPDVMFALSQQFPHAFDSDKYGRFDGKIPSSSMMQFIGDLRDDKTLSNTERAKHMNEVLSKKKSLYDPQ